MRYISKLYARHCYLLQLTTNESQTFTGIRYYFHHVWLRTLKGSNALQFYQIAIKAFNYILVYTESAYTNNLKYICTYTLI